MQPLPPRFVLDPVPVRRPARLQVLLFVATAATTFAAGVVGWEPVVLGIDADLAGQLGPHWQRGLVYMAAVLAVLAAHEAGHFVAALVHRIPATLPLFIPMPVLLTGTLGAVIGMEGSRADRRQLFDIAIAGPIAGLVVANTAVSGCRCLPSNKAASASSSNSDSCGLGSLRRLTGFGARSSSSR